MGTCPTNTDGSLTPFVAKYCTALGFDMDMLRTMSAQELICAMSEKLNEVVCFDNETRDLVNEQIPKVDAAIGKIPDLVSQEVDEFTSSAEFQEQIDGSVGPVVDRKVAGLQSQITANSNAISGMQAQVATKANQSDLEELGGVVDRKVAGLQSQITANSNAISGMQAQVATKANQSDLEELGETVDGLAPTARLKNVIVIGDSWTNGTQGGDDIVYRFTDYMTATGSFKRVYNRGVGGAGFGTSRETTFLQIAQAAKAANEPADAIIVFGGCNDDVEDVDAQVTATFNYLKTNWPKADLYFAHNINRNSLMANFLQVNSREAAAMTAGAAVIQGFPQVLRNMDNYFTAEKWHMTTQAYKYIGAVFCAVLKGCEMPLPSYMHSVTESGQWTPAGATFTHWQKTMDGPLCQNLIQLTTTKGVAVGGSLGRLSVEMIPPIAKANSVRCFAMFSSGSTQSISECLIDDQGNVTVSQTIPNGSTIHLQISYPQKSLQILPVPNPIDVNNIDAL